MYVISNKKRRAFFFTPATVGLFLVLLMMAVGPLNAFAGEYDDDYEECEDFDAYYFLNGEGGCVSVYDKPDGRERVRLYNGLDVEYQFGKNEGSAWKHIRIIGYYDLGMLGYVREEDLEDCTYFDSTWGLCWRNDYDNSFCEAELTSDTALSGMDGERIGFLFAGVRLLVVGETENDYFVLIRNSATAGLVPKNSVVISQNRYTMNAELNMINDASVNNKDGEACIYPTCEIETEEWNCYPLSAGDRIAIFYHVSGGWSFVGYLSSSGIVKYTGFIEDRYIVSPEQ